MSRRVSFGVISDLHACKSTSTPPSFYCAESTTQAKNNPVASLIKFSKKRGLTVDYLLCPGDLADKAVPECLQQAWCDLHELARALSAKELYATTGNHDIDSRYTYNKYDAKGVLQSLDPVYPLGSTELADRYWSRHYVILTLGEVRLVLLNSSAFHGGGKSGKEGSEEFERGRISAHTLQRLSAELEASPKHDVNILMCHHHPHQHSELGLGADDLIDGGEDLINELSKGHSGRWLIVHGHKHHPKIENAKGFSASPVVFSAGSVATKIWPEVGARCRNQFYILQFDLDDPSRPDGFGGTFQAWDWLPSYGWTEATIESGLPAHGGFGWRGDPSALASEIAPRVRGKRLEWKAFLSEFPRCQYLLPEDWRVLIGELEKHKIEVLERKGMYVQVACNA